MFGAKGGTAAGGGGGMLRTFRRAVRAGAAGATRDSFSHSSTSSSYKPISSSNPASLSSWPLVLSARKSDDLDWVSVDESGDEIEKGFNFDNDNDHSVFGKVPDRDEVLNAVSALQLVIDPTHYSQFLGDNSSYNLETVEEDENTTPIRSLSRVSSFGSESDWMEPSMHICYPRLLERQGSIRAYDAFHLLRTETSIKRMVVSLSSDKAVWDAVLNNEMVRELRNSLSEVESKIPNNLNEDNNDPETTTNIFSRIYEIAKMKVNKLFDNIAELVNDLFQLSEDEKIEESLSAETREMLKISLLFSIMVLIIVVLDRTHGALP